MNYQVLTQLLVTNYDYCHLFIMLPNDILASELIPIRALSNNHNYDYAYKQIYVFFPKGTITSRVNRKVSSANQSCCKMTLQTKHVELLQTRR